MHLHTSPGKSYPLGATVYPNGVNFSLFSKNANAVEILLFDQPDAPHPSHTITLDSKNNKTFHYWHIFIEGITHGQVYGYRVYGPTDLKKGHRFNGSKVLLDPYAKSVYTPETYSREAAIKPGDNCASAMRSVVIDTQLYDWEGDQPLHHSFAKTIIYEMHVGGFTRHPSSDLQTELRGTYQGLIEKIPYLKELGITAVELLPVQQFDEHDAKNGLVNYWGYSPIAFFAIHNGYSTDRNHPTRHLDEFRNMVKALHKAGIEVILDVVFNHTAEYNHSGPTLCFRGIENEAYYILDKNKSKYKDYTGCGNTVNTNHAVVKRMIVDCLQYWVTEMHIDGFRFDLASVLARDMDGEFHANPPVLWAIDSDPVLAGTKIIAEPWDAAGLYLAGEIAGHKWAEWNGVYRDDVRRMLRGDLNSVQPLIAKISASYDLYKEIDRDANRSINFVTCHDGFTLNDLVTYNQKYNLANGENNQDGSDQNFSWNCGTEGPSDDPVMNQLRERQVKNFLTILFFSQGTPMLLMGDEVRRTQQGNNNAYCQNNDLSWFDWFLVQKNKDLLRFVQKLSQLNIRYEIFQDSSYWALRQKGKPQRISWHGIQPGKPDLGAHSHSIAYLLNYHEAWTYLYVIINAYKEALDFTLPLLENHIEYKWYRLIDTFLTSPDDFCQENEAPELTQSFYKAASRSVVVLLARKKIIPA